MVNGCNTTGVKTATDTCIESRCRIASFTVSATGNTAGSVTFWDSNAATTSGKKKLAVMYVGAETTAHNYQLIMSGALAMEGVYAVVTGTINYSIEYF